MLDVDGHVISPDALVERVQQLISTIDGHSPAAPAAIAPCPARGARRPGPRDAAAPRGTTPARPQRRDGAPRSYRTNLQARHT